MENIEYNDRLDKVFQLLIEISKGNFSYRLERSDKKDELEALTAIVNIVAEEIKDSFLHQGYINMHDSYMHLVQMTFLLNEKFEVVHLSQDVPTLLNFTQEELLHTPFWRLLHKDSLVNWDRIKKAFILHSSSEKNMKLVFRTKEAIQLPANCKIMGLPSDTISTARYMVISSDIIKNTQLQERKLKSKILRQIRLPKSKTKHLLEEKSFLKVSDIEKFRAIGTYLKNNPDKAAPSLKDLAHEFGTNEYKLKRGFKELYGMTVFQFIKNERLRNAHILVKSSNEPFKRIARQNGFKNATHFSREFKARYGYTPRDLRANS